MKTGRIVLRLATIAMLAVSILAIANLWTDLRRQQDTLADARSDNVQWTVGQAMVEYQDLTGVLLRLESRGTSPEGLAELRQRFDILYNRMDILNFGRLYRHLLEDPAYAADFTRVFDALRAELPLIDADVAVLAAALPDLGQRLTGLEPHLRGFILSGVRVFAAHSTALHEGLTRTMNRVAWLSAAMLGLLLGLTAILFRESRLAEVRLVAQQRSAARLDTILGTSNDAIVVAGVNGRIVEFNGAAEGLFGLTADAAHDRMLHCLLQPDTDNWRPDRALAGERAKAEFVAVTSHELRTPLNGILGMLALLRDTALTERQRDYIARMETSGQILLASVDDVLEISRTEAGHVGLSPVPTALEPLLRSVADSQSGAAAAQGNRIRFQALNPLPDRALVDPGRVRQVLVNLIGNAVKFTAHGEIALEVEMRPATYGRPMLILRVSDTGIGIAEADQDRIFEDFETLDPSLTRNHGGAGLGLAIVRRLVEAMEGEIDVESEPGAGSIFTITLPVEISPEAPASVAPEPAGNADIPHGARVLVVEEVQTMAPASGNLAELGRRAHRLAGAAQNFGARQLAARLGRLQQAVAEDDRETAKAAANALPADWAGARAALGTWRADMPVDQTS